MEKIRRATHTGSWYTDTPKKLSEELDGWLKASGLTKSSDVRGVIAPHAGYSYSGPAAAFAFANIDPEEISRVFLFGPSHHHYTPKCALSRATVYKTPIGNLPIDREEIDVDEFKKVMALMRAHNRQGSFHCDGLRAGHNVGGSVENGGLEEYFFGKDGNKRLHHDKFVQFLRDIHDEMLRLEFAHYDYKNRGTISAKDFALSMVASADLKHLNKLLNRVDDFDNKPDLNNIRITPEEFKNFAELRKKLQPFSLALFSFGQVNGLLTRKDFKRAAFQVCGISLSDNVIEIIFHVFDANGDGSLSGDELIRVLKKRERDIAQPSEAGLFSFLSCCWNCTHGCSNVFNLLS